MSNFLIINLEKIFEDVLKPIIAKKNMKENLKIKGRIIY